MSEVLVGPGADQAGGIEVGRTATGGASIAYQAHYVRLVRLARQLLGDVESAEEAVQDVFVRLQHRPRPDELTYAYLRVAVVNQCRSALRRRLLQRRTNDGQSMDAARTDSLATGVADRDQIRHALARLSPRQREVVVLRYYEDLSLQDIATALNMSTKAVSAALARALDSISTYVGGQR